METFSVLTETNEFWNAFILGGTYSTCYEILWKHLLNISLFLRNINCFT